jgi:hypothetical protein
VPLAVLVVARAIAGELAPGRLIARLAAILLAQFLISIEVFATMTAVGGLALFLGWSSAPADTGKRIMKAIPPIAIAYAEVAAIVAPYLYYLFAFGAPHGQMWSLHACSSDLLNFIVPSPTNALGAIPLIDRLAAPMVTCGIAQEEAYIGLPPIILAAAYAWHYWREPTGKVLVDTLVIICVLAMGPILHFRGAELCALPGKILGLTPLLDKALPARLMVFPFRLLAIIASLWFAQTKFGPAAKIALAATIVVSILPNLSAGCWTRPDDSSAFFTTDVQQSAQ